MYKKPGRDLEWKELVKRKENDKLKRILSKCSPFDLVDVSGRTVLHLAIKHNNLELVEYLLNFKDIVDAATTFKLTPLMTAVTNDRFEAAKLLLTNAEPDICLANAEGRTALQMAASNKKAPRDLMQKIVERLRKSGATTDRIAELLDDAGLPLKRLLPLNDVALTRATLDRRDFIGSAESAALVRQTMKYPSRENARNLAILLDHGPGQRKRKTILLKEISRDVERFFPRWNSDYLRDLMTQLIRLDVVDEHFVAYFARVFNRGCKSAVKVLLSCGVESHVRYKYGRDILVHLFGNHKVNAARLTRSRKFDVDARGRRGRAALHFAVMSGLRANARYLLERGANVDARDAFGQSPLFVAGDAKCVRMLLEYEADVCASDAEGLTVLDVCHCWDSLRLVLARIAVVEARDDGIEREIYDRIEANRTFKDFYEECREQIDWMKRRFVFRSVSLFGVLTEKPEVVARCVKYKEAGSATMDWCGERRVHGYYFAELKSRLRRAEDIYRLRIRAAAVVGEAMRLFDPNHLVVQRIISFFAFGDLLAFS